MKNLFSVDLGSIDLFSKHFKYKKVSAHHPSADIATILKDAQRLEFRNIANNAPKEKYIDIGLNHFA